MAEKPDATLEELSEKLARMLGRCLHISAVCRRLKRAKLTLKKVLHASELTTRRVQDLRESFRQDIEQVPVEKLVFVDESGMSRLGRRALPPPA